MEIYFVLIFVYSFPENLIVSEADNIALVCEIEHVIDNSRAFRMVFGHIENSCQQFSH